MGRQVVAATQIQEPVWKPLSCDKLIITLPLPSSLTGYASAVDESKAYAAGYDVHMTKPVELRGLAATVNKLAGRSQSLTHTAASKSNP